MGPWYGPLPPFKGSELWCPVISKVAFNGIIMGLEGLRTRGPCYGTMESTLEYMDVLPCVFQARPTLIT